MPDASSIPKTGLLRRVLPPPMDRGCSANDLLDIMWAAEVRGNAYRMHDKVSCIREPALYKFIFRSNGSKVSSICRFGLLCGITKHPEIFTFFD